MLGRQFGVERFAKIRNQPVMQIGKVGRVFEKRVHSWKRRTHDLSLAVQMVLAARQGTFLSTPLYRG